MLAETLRFPWLAALVVAPLAFVSPSPVETPIPPCLDLPIIKTRPSPQPVISAKARAERLYRQGDFAGAVAEVRATDPDLAELYDQFGVRG
jgi:hypothetical protein